MRKERRDMNDKELDDFFRKKSEQAEIPYREEDWDKLKAKLDHPSPSGGINGSGHRNKGWWIGLLALMIISGAGLGWKYWVLGTENSGIKADSLKANQSFDPSTVETQHEFKPINEIDNQKKPENPLDDAALPFSDFPAKRETTKVRMRENLKDRGKPIKPEVDAVSFFNTRGFKVPEERPGIASIELSQQINQVLPLNLVLDEKEQRIQKTIEESTRKRSTISEPKEDKKNMEGSRFSVALTVAPDVSALKIKDIAGLGNSVGLNLEYFIHPNLSINMGALYAFKTYKAGEGYNTGYVPAPSNISGNCWVLDLPLNIRYYAVNQRLGRWYLSAGLSSYLMLREKYDLKYTSYNYGGNAYDNQLEIKNQNRHYLDIINLGLGYERVLTDRLALQVEPYLKLPLKGIGEGNIHLKSAGALVGLKYRW